MTAYGLVGTNNGKKGTIESALDDLLEAANQAEDDFWLILPYDGKASDGVERVLDWVSEVDALHYELVTPQKFKADKDDEFYEGAAKLHSAKDIDGTIVRLLTEAAESEEGALLVLLDEDDEDLLDTIREATAKNLGAFDILDAAAPLEFGDDADGEEEEAEPEPEPEKPARRAAGGRRGTGAAAPTAPPEKGKPGRKPKAAAEEPEDGGEEPEEEEAAPAKPARGAAKKAAGATKKAAAAKAPEEEPEPVVVSDETMAGAGTDLGRAIADGFIARLAERLGLTPF